MKIRTIFLSIFTISCLFSQEILWYKSMERGKQVAMKGKKPLLVFFSDGSIWAQKLESLFNEPSFQKKGKNLFTFCLLHTKELPKVVLIDPEYGNIAQIGYIPKCKADYLKVFQEKIRMYLEIKKAIMHPSGCNLEKMYILSTKLDCTHFQKKLLEIGLEQEKGIFFLLTQYEELLKKDPLNHRDIQIIQEELNKKDPKNIQGTHLKVAMLNFHRLALESAPKDEVTAPLISYAKKFQKKDRKNLWKVYLTISQYLSVKKEYSAALNYARLSYKESPKEVKKNILNCIRYLKKKRKL